MLSFLTCSAFTADDDDFDFYKSSIATSLDRGGTNRLKFIRRRRKSTTIMTVSSPMNFRHDVHLGNDVNADGTFTLWDADRWRLELAKKDLILPSLSVPTQPLSTPSKRSVASQRNSFTPQKRKPVPSLLLPLPPHQVPLPPSPTSESLSESEGSEPVPPLDPPSRGPSIDEEDDRLSLSTHLDAKPSQWEQPALKEDQPAAGIHESVLLLQNAC